MNSRLDKNFSKIYTAKSSIFRELINNALLSFPLNLSALPTQISPHSRDVSTHTSFRLFSPSPVQSIPFPHPSQNHTITMPSPFYLFAIIPFYVLIWVPLSNILFGSDLKHQYEDDAALQLQLNSSLIATNDPLYCPEHTYNTYILSQEPLVIYIEGFLRGNESEHLVGARLVFSFSPCFSSCIVFFKGGF